MKWLAAALAVVLVLLQYRIWVSDNGVRKVERLKQAVALQQAEDAQLAERNRQLAAEVRDLKTGMDALEERARSDLGMIARNETFYQVVPTRPAAGAPPTRTGSLTRSAAAPATMARMRLRRPPLKAPSATFSP